MMDDVRHFWTPPRPGEQILGIINYQDMFVIATSNGIYSISHGRSLEAYVVQYLGDIVANRDKDLEIERLNKIVELVMRHDSNLIDHLERHAKEN